MGSLQAGDTAYFRQGTHNQGGVATCSAPDVEFTSSPGERATIIGPSSGGRFRFFGARQWIHHLNLHQTGGPADAGEHEMTGQGTRIEDNDITNNFGQPTQSHAIKFYIDAPDIQSRRNFIHQIGRPGSEDGGANWTIFAHAYYVRKNGINFLSEDDRFFEVLGGYCVHCYSGGTSATIRRARVEDSYFFVAGQGNTRITAENCAYVWNRGTGGLPTRTDGAAAAHPYRSVGGWESSGGPATITNSASIANAGSDGTDGINSNVTVSGILVQDAQFTNPAAGNFNIGNAAVAAHIGAGPVNPKPDPPTGLTVQAGYDTGPFFTLTWLPNDSSPPVAAYQVFRGGLAVAGTYLPQYTDRAAFTEGQLVQHRVTAVGTDGQISDPSTQITTAALGPPTVDPPPNAPTGLTVQPGYDTESFVAIDWADNPASPPVNVYNVTLNGNIVALIPASLHRQGGLVPGTSYTVAVRAVGTDGQSSPPTTAPAFIAQGAPTQPGVPTGLTVTPGFDTVSYFDMDWDDVATARGYVVYVNNTRIPVPPQWGQLDWEEFDWTELVSLYQFRGGSAGQTFSFQVASVNAQGVESGRSAAVSATAIGSSTPVTPAAPSGLTVTAGYDTAPFLTCDWEDVAPPPTIAAYQVTVNGTVAAGTFASLYTHRVGVLVGNSYTVQVRAISDEGVQGPLSSGVTEVAIGGTVDPEDNPLKPTGLTVTPGYSAGPRMTLNWADNTEPGVTYKVYRTPGGLIAQNVATSGPYIDSVGLTSGQTYSYAVQAVLASGLASPDSDPASAVALGGGSSQAGKGTLKLRLGLKGRKPGTAPVDPPPPPPPPDFPLALSRGPTGSRWGLDCAASGAPNPTTANVQFASSADFRWSVGINHHPEYLDNGQDPLLAVQKIAELGIYHVRIGMYGPANYHDQSFHAKTWNFLNWMKTHNGNSPASAPKISCLMGVGTEPGYYSAHGGTWFTINNTNGTGLRLLDGPPGTIRARR